MFARYCSGCGRPFTCFRLYSFIVGEAMERGGWLPVQESIPPVGERVLCFIPQAATTTVGWIDEDGSWLIEESFSMDFQVSHWQVLPMHPEFSGQTAVTS